MAVQLGKRYGADWVETGATDKEGNPIREAGVQILVIKPGDCVLHYGGVPMELIKPTILPSAD